MSEVNALEGLKIGDIVSWPKVSQIHKSRNGIYHRNGSLISLLTDFGRINPCYPDFRGDSPETIHYTGSGRRGNQRLDAANRALFNSINSRCCVPLFNKLEVGRWQFLGYFMVTAGDYVFDEGRDRMVWRFTLVAAQPTDCH
jgi:hypothetical protein